LRDGKIEGRIVLTGRLSVDGVFEEMRVLSSDRPELEQPTLETLARVRWEPARLRGKSVAVPLTIGIRYVLAP
jgi:outer membrane biosynthesis protein TonB